MKIKMLKTVEPDFPIIFFSDPGTKLIYGETYEANINKNGAVSGICRNGDMIGVRPGEFEVIGA